MYQVFICYSEEEMEFVKELYNSLNRISEIDPYVADFFRLSGKELKDKIKEEIIASNFIVALLTHSGVKSQWVNQEIGFACAHHEDINIIPVKEENVVINAFLEGKEYTNFYRDDYERTITEIIYDLRIRIPEELHIELKCPICSGIAEYPLADQSLINNVISDGTNIIQQCSMCQNQDKEKWIEYNPKTLEQILQ